MAGPRLGRRALPRPALAVALALSLLLAASPLAAATVDPGDVEDEVICIQCKRPLSTSSGDAADDQRAFIQQLAADGLSKDEIKARLVEEYGERVLVDDANPIASVAPWVAGAVGLLAVGFVLLRRTRNDGAGTDPADDGDELALPAADDRPEPSADDQARIDAELAALED